MTICTLIRDADTYFVGAVQLYVIFFLMIFWQIIAKLGT